MYSRVCLNGSRSNFGWQTLSSIGLMLVLVCTSGYAHAAEKKDKAARRIQMIMQKAEQEKAAIQAEYQAKIDQASKTQQELEEKAKKSNEQAGAMKASVSQSKKQIALLTTDLQKVKEEKLAVEAKHQQALSLIETQKSGIAELNQQIKKLQTELATAEVQRKSMSSNFQQKEKKIEQCEAKNAKLYQYGQDLVKIYDRPSTYEQVMRTEPFFQLKRVELENILQDYQDKLDEQKYVNVPK